jgi:CubicO group peptidase (beta-lactamase class C family)
VRSKSHGWRYKFGLVSVAVIIVLGAGVAFNYERLHRLYRVVKLFDKGVIIENFRNMDDIFAKRIVHGAAKPSIFERALQPLPSTFNYNGKNIDLQKFLEDQWTTGLVVIKDGQITFEEYWLGNDETTKAISWSVSKSMISALVGIAIEEGLIKDIHAPVTEYVRFLKGTGYDGVPIKHILQMSSGVRFNEDYADFHSDINRMGRMMALNTPIDDFVASLENGREPGTYHHYVSMDTQVLAMVLREVTKTTVASFMEEKLWKRIGTESDGYWLVDKNGMELAFGAFNAVLRDYARFGLLYLQNGRWDGKTIVPSDWVHASVTPDAPHLQPGDNPLSYWVLGYGYQWWIPVKPEGDFLAMGIYGQYIYIHPTYRVVIAKTSAYSDYKIDGRDKHLQTIEMFRTITKLGNQEKM